MSEMTSDDDLYINLEPAVLLALSKLQRTGRYSKKHQTPLGVSCKKIVEFLKANYTWVDGDVKSQVLTALFSGVKTGVVCALDNCKFYLIRATANQMISNCVTRVSHGPKCICLSMLKSLFKTSSCCYLKRKPVKKTKKPQTKLKPVTKPKPLPKRKKSKPVRKKCAQNAQNLIGTSKSEIIKENFVEKCKFCTKIHSLPKLKKLCMKCYPIGKLSPVPADKFSPRDEHTPPLENIITNALGVVA